MHVYFVPDPLNPRWKVVRDVEPRSQRINLESLEETLSALGRRDATMNINLGLPGLEEGVVLEAEPVLEVDVAHVVAHEERDDKNAHLDVDEEHGQDVDDHNDTLTEPESELPGRGPGIWDLL